MNKRTSTLLLATLAACALVGSASATGLRGNGDGVAGSKDALCGCLCPWQACFVSKPCTQAEHAAELARCSMGPWFGSPGPVIPPTGSARTAMVGGDRDAHGCVPSAGFTWCAAKRKCVQPWVEPCDSKQPAGRQLHAMHALTAKAQNDVCTGIVSPIFGMLTSEGACVGADVAIDAACAALTAAAAAELGLNPVADAAAGVCDAAAVAFNVGCGPILESILDGTQTSEEAAEAFCSAHF